jgi:hypothetical protein
MSTQSSFKHQLSLDDFLIDIHISEDPEYYGDAFKEVECKIYPKNIHEKAGVVNGFLVDVNSFEIGAADFAHLADPVCESLYDFAVGIKKMSVEERIERCFGGDFFYLSELDIYKKYRGNKLGAKAVRKVVDELAKEWGITSCILKPYPIDAPTSGHTITSLRKYYTKHVGAQKFKPRSAYYVFKA